MSVLGLIMSFRPYLRSAMVRFPLYNYVMEAQEAMLDHNFCFASTSKY